MNLLKAKIIEKGFTVSDVASALEISEQAVYMIIRGERKIKAAQLQALKDLLELTDAEIKTIFLPVGWKVIPQERK